MSEKLLFFFCNGYPQPTVCLDVVTTPNTRRIELLTFLFFIMWPRDDYISMRPFCRALWPHTEAYVRFGLFTQWLPFYLGAMPTQPCLFGISQQTGCDCEFCFTRLYPFFIRTSRTDAKPAFGTLNNKTEK